MLMQAVPSSSATFLALAMLAGACVEPVVGADGGIDGGLPDAGAPDGGPPADLDGFVRHYMQPAAAAGVAAAIVTADGVEWTGAWGLANVADEVAVTEDTLFAVASVSKTVATLAALQLVDEGTLDLDAPVDDYLPYAVRNPAFPDTPVTARMLLTHTSGLVDDFLVLAEVSTTGDPEVSMAAFSEGYVTPGGAYFRDGNWGFEPGTDYDYCNANFGVLGHLVEVVADADFRDRTRATIFDPLGMPGTGWFLADVDVSMHALPYSYGPRTGFVAQPFQGVSFYPASTLRTSAAELGRFLAATIRAGELDGVRVVEEATSLAMREIQRPDLDPDQALTWYRGTIAGMSWLEHTGSAGGVSTIIAFRPDANVGFLVLSNSDAFVLQRAGLREPADALRQIIARIAMETNGYL
jgi:CubicO group peptidase (beta-lactamase class C family)